MLNLQGAEIIEQALEILKEKKSNASAYAYLVGLMMYHIPTEQAQHILEMAKEAN